MVNKTIVVRSSSVNPNEGPENLSATSTCDAGKGAFDTFHTESSREAKNSAAAALHCCAQMARNVRAINAL